MKKLLIVLIAPFIFTGVNAVEVQAKKPVLKAATVSADLKFDSVYTVEAINEVHIVNPRLVFAKDVGYGQEVYPFSFDPLDGLCYYLGYQGFVRVVRTPYTTPASVPTWGFYVASLPTGATLRVESVTTYGVAPFRGSLVCRTK